MTRRANIGVHTRHDTGYGRFGLEIRKALLGLGVIDYGGVGTGPSTLAQGGFAEPSDGRLAPVSLVLSTPPHVRSFAQGQFSVLFTMWESTVIPAGFRENVPPFDRIFVPSQQNVELFSNFHPDVRYIPLGVSADWVYRKREAPTRVFNFLTGGAGPRKGNQDVVRAFHAAFKDWNPIQSGGPRPHLTVLAKDAQPSHDVTVIGTKLSRGDELELYARSHCFVSMTRGEGWGLMPLQAICQGLPTILPDAHGHTAFAKYGIPTSVDLEPCGNSTFWGDGGEWWVPDFDETVERMRYVYAHWEDDFDVARYAAITAGAEFTWRKTAQLVIDNLPEMEGPDLPSDTPFVPAPTKLYRTAVVERKELVVNGQRHAFIPGVEDWVPWDIKMMLGNQGVLAPDCIDPLEMGEELSGIIRQKSMNHRCPHCSQRYGSDRSLDLDALAEAGFMENSLKG